MLRGVLSILTGHWKLSRLSAVQDGPKWKPFLVGPVPLYVSQLRVRQPRLSIDQAALPRLKYWIHLQVSVPRIQFLVDRFKLKGSGDYSGTNEINLCDHFCRNVRKQNELLKV